MGRNNKLLTLDYVRAEVEKSGERQLLSTCYINNRTPLLFKCLVDTSHKDYWARYDNIQAGKGCPTCAGRPNLTYEDVKKEIEHSGTVRLLATEYVNNATKMEMKCLIDDSHPIFYKTYNHFKHDKHNCPMCYIDSRLLTFDHVKENVERDGTTLLLEEQYIKSTVKMKMRCLRDNKHPIFYMSYGAFQYNQNRCPNCSNIISEGELEVGDFVRTCYDGVIIRNDRTQIVNPMTNSALELDIWLPELNKAIEYNGHYYHSFPDYMVRDKIKRSMCSNKNIDLLLVWDEEWHYTKNRCMEKIRTFLGVD